MIKDKKDLAVMVEGKISSSIGTQRRLRAYASALKDKFNLPSRDVADVLSMKTSLEDYSDFIVYCFADVVLDGYKTNDWFTQEEIDLYSKTKIVEEKIKFPLVFKMLEVSSDQWIGKTSFKQLMELRNAQLINYNENTQRTMQHIVNGDQESFRISLNRSAVRQISEAYRSDTYIPNTITLNMPDDTVYFYNEESGELVIKELRYFDILDGYHRYIAGSNETNMNAEFDYPMELRIVAFPESKAKQFIFQEDQKTKMRKIDSDAMNMNSYANRIVSYLNTSPTCNMSGQISRNAGVINMAYLGQLINDFYIRGNSKKKVQEEWLDYRTEIERKLNIVTSEDNDLRTKEWDFALTMCAVYMFKNEGDDSVLTEKIHKMYDILMEHKDQYYDIWKQKVVSGPKITRLGKIYQKL